MKDTKYNKFRLLYFYINDNDQLVKNALFMMLSEWNTMIWIAIMQILMK